MSSVVRPIIRTKHVKTVRELVNHPDSTDFDDSLAELIRQFQKLKESQK